MDTTKLQDMRDNVQAIFPDVQILYMKKNTYCDRQEDMLQIRKGLDKDWFIIDIINAKEASAYMILRLVTVYVNAYKLAEDRTESRIRESVRALFKFEENDE